MILDPSLPRITQLNPVDGSVSASEQFLFALKTRQSHSPL